ncbi:MAG: thioesterase family protein, partial [Hyphomonadaceae bacterium]
MSAHKNAPRSAAQETLPLLMGQGAANAWECDEMGHLNVRFHVLRLAMGLGALARALGMENAFKPAAGATLLPLDLYIRFQREVRAGGALLMRGGVLEASDTEATIYAELRHPDGQPASSFILRCAHAEPRSMKAFAWAGKARAAFERLACTAPKHGQPRTIDLSHAPRAFDLAKADALGVKRTALSMVLPSDCDAFERLRLDSYIGRTSDAVPALFGEWRAEAAAALAAQDGVAREGGSAAVEFRIVFRRWPRAGDGVEVRSAFVEVMEKANRVMHWLIDPASGAAWASMEAV